MNPCSHNYNMHFVFPSSSLAKTNVTVLSLIGYFVIGHCVLTEEFIRYSYFYKHFLCSTRHTVQVVGKTVPGQGLIREQCVTVWGWVGSTIASLVQVLVPKYIFLQISVCLTSQLVRLSQSTPCLQSLGWKIVIFIFYQLRICWVVMYFVTIAFFVQVNQWKGRAMTLRWVFWPRGLLGCSSHHLMEWLTWM